MPAIRAIITAGAAVAALMGLHPVVAAPGDVAEYTAEYQVRYKGRRVARAEFSVAAITDGEYTFRSSTMARGIWRVAAPNPAIEQSHFGVDESLIVPIHFEYQDGSRKGEDNFSVDFDAAAAEIRVIGPDGARQLPLERGLLDRGSLQVALMRDLGSCVAPGPYSYVDDDGINTYAYERLEDLETETGIGTFNTVRFAQHREGSSRTTILWLAPALAYLPVRMEQQRNGEIETVFELEDASGIERSASDCSGFR